MRTESASQCPDPPGPPARQAAGLQDIRRHTCAEGCEDKALNPPPSQEVGGGSLPSPGRLAPQRRPCPSVVLRQRLDWVLKQQHHVRIANSGTLWTYVGRNQLPADADAAHSLSTPAQPQTCLLLSSGKHKLTAEETSPLDPKGKPPLRGERKASCPRGTQPARTTNTAPGFKNAREEKSYRKFRKENQKK